MMDKKGVTIPYEIGSGGANLFSTAAREAGMGRDELGEPPD